MAFPIDRAEPSSLDLDPNALDRLVETVTRHVAERRYPGAQIAIARRGKLALLETIGDARIDPTPVRASEETLWLLYSNTKVVTACALWLLAERGAFSFTDTVAEHLPGFERKGKGNITLIQLLTHQGGFPNAHVPPAAWTDHDLLRKIVCGFTLEWLPGSRVEYHTTAAHWTAAAMIEAVTKEDFRDFIRANVIEPLGLGDELFVGLPETHHYRAADIHEPVAHRGGQVRRTNENSTEFRCAGLPGNGGFGTARAMATFYQMMAYGGEVNGVRLLSPRMVEYVTRNYTEDRVDTHVGVPMHRGLGPYSRGTTETIRGLGSMGSPRVFGHGGVGSSVCWADPDSGVSFAYLTNSRVPDPWHNQRLDVVSNLAHMAIR